MPRDTAFVSPIPEGENTACQFRSSRDVTLWPLSIEEVRLTAAPPDMPALHRYLPPNIHVAGALRITLRTFGELTFSELAGPARLPFTSAAKNALRHTCLSCYIPAPSPHWPVNPVTLTAN